MRLYLKCLTIGLLVFSLGSCNKASDGESSPSVSHIEINDVDLIRFDQEINKLDVENIAESYEALLKRYPGLTELYFQRLIEIPNSDQESYYNSITDFLNAGSIQTLQDTIDIIFKDTKDIESELLLACKYLKFYFPNIAIPSFYTFHTEFGYQNIIFSDGDGDGIGIGLDFFLGESFDYKMIDPQNPSFSDYLTRSYTSEHIVRKSMALILQDILGSTNGKRFVDHMVHQGKQLYTLEKILPHVEDSIVFEYSEVQLAWLEANELEIWSFFLDKNLMYETNQARVLKYINPAPHSAGMPPEAPGRTAAYLGYKIVKAFMQKNSDYSLQELIDFSDAQKLMEISKYKPRRR